MKVCSVRCLQEVLRYEFMKNYKFDNDNPKESDWKLFRKKLPVWQEAYMEKLCKEYLEILKKDEDASNKFWNLRKQILKDADKVGVKCEMSRSLLVINLVNLLKEKAITPEDLKEFSKELKSTVLNLSRRRYLHYDSYQSCNEDEDIIESDENFSFIAEYTDAGFAYGTERESGDDNIDNGNGIDSEEIPF